MKSDVIRSEEWTTNEGWGISTLVLDVYEGDRVKVTENMLPELGLEGGEDDTDAFFERFVKWFSYEEVSTALKEKGFSYASAT